MIFSIMTRNYNLFVEGDFISTNALKTGTNIDLRMWIITHKFENKLLKNGFCLEKRQLTPFFFVTFVTELKYSFNEQELH